MISDHFDERQLKQLLEVAAFAMADNSMAGVLNMEDPLMAELQDELVLFLELEADRIDDWRLTIPKTKTKQMNWIFRLMDGDNGTRPPYLVPLFLS